MNIAVCENSAAAAEQMRGWIEQYCRLYHVPAVLNCFPSSTAFSAHEGHFTIVYLCSGGSTGFYLARQLRERDPDCKIILVDDTQEFAVPGNAAPLHRLYSPPGGVPAHCPKHEPGTEGAALMERACSIKRRKAASPEPKELEQGLRRQMAWAAGTEAFQNRDPLYHVTESFQQTFDAMGRRHAAQLGPEETPQEQSPEGEAARQWEEMPDPTSARSFYERDRAENQDLLRRFSETAFQRGTLSGAVLQGTGQMMLFSCLKKTVGQSQPDKWQQRKLFEKASPMRNVPGHSPDKVVFNRGFTDSAVGLVVDTLRDARRTVEDMRDLALGKSEMGQSGSGYPTHHVPLPGRQPGAGAAGAVPGPTAPRRKIPRKQPLFRTLLPGWRR